MDPGVVLGRIGVINSNVHAFIKCQRHIFRLVFLKIKCFDQLTEKHLADEKAAFDEYGFLWFFDLAGDAE